MRCSTSAPTGRDTMSKWSTSQGTCHKCGNTGKVYPSFGKLICGECKNARPKQGTGNSGMFESSQELFVFDDGLSLARCKKSNETFGKLYFAHYPGSKGIPGRSLCYLIQYKNSIAGIIGFNSPPKNYGIFNTYFGGKNKENNFLINNVFRLINNEKNLATRVMKLARKTIKEDYEKKYGDILLGIVTFVEPPRTGALYKADNWDYLGYSAGKEMKRDSDTWEKIFTEGSKKLIFGYRYKCLGNSIVPQIAELIFSQPAFDPWRRPDAP